MTQTEKLLQDCLESLSNLSKQELLEETEQLLLSLAERSNNPVKDLTLLRNYYNTNK
jgi:hypothetical protein